MWAGEHAMHSGTWAHKQARQVDTSACKHENTLAGSAKLHTLALTHLTHHWYAPYVPAHLHTYASYPLLICACMPMHLYSHK